MVSDVVLKIEEDNDERRMDEEVRERDRIRLEHQAHEGKRARHVQVSPNTAASEKDSQSCFVERFEIEAA